MVNFQFSTYSLFMFNNLDKYHVILASQSPRRKELLEKLGIDFEVRTLPDIPEDYPDGLSGKDIALFIATQKARHYRAMMAEKDLVITADTIVCVDEKVLGKPKDAQEAADMLRMLSGRSHQVITAFTVSTLHTMKADSVTTNVRFAQLSDEVIDYYVSHFKPFDKAGAYGIQEWIGCVGVESIEGSFFNVVGLPVQRLSSVLLTF